MRTKNTFRKNIFNPVKFILVTCLTTVLLLSVGLRCFASTGDLDLDDKLEQLHFRYSFEVAEVLKPLDNLTIQYKKSLEQQRDRFQAAGNLEGVIVVTRELAALDEGNFAGESKDTDPAEFIKQREIFLREKLVINERLREPLAGVNKRHAARLDEMIRDLTRAGQIEQGLRVKRLADEFNASTTKEEQVTPERLVKASEEMQIEIKDGVIMTFCWIPPGKFTMGSPSNEEGRSDDENQVEVILIKGFWMAKTEVTQAQWEAVMGSNPSRFKGANLPVENVSWNDVQDFLKKVNRIAGKSDGRKMVLPTEAQWEYAARAGEDGPYSGGAIGEVAWYDANSDGRTHPVGTKNPNAWGLHDMHGNVWEWCADWYDAGLPGGTDPSGPSSGTLRVLRGGSWLSFGAGSCRAADRYGNAPGEADYSFGFRLARSSFP